MRTCSSDNGRALSVESLACRRLRAPPLDQRRQPILQLAVMLRRNQTLISHTQILTRKLQLTDLHATRAPECHNKLLQTLSDAMRR